MKTNKGPVALKGMLIVAVAVSAGIIAHRQFFSPPDVILITVDALRADHLSGYGYPRKTSPALDAFAEDGVTFLNCFATSSATVSATPGLLTGRYVTSRKFEPYWDNILDKRFTTLAEYLKNFGYHTAAFLGNQTFRVGRGFEQGFDLFYVKAGIDAQDLSAQVVRFLNRPLRRKPVFVWVHYMEPHSPYEYRE
jgi:arylsulfatase